LGIAAFPDLRRWIGIARVRQALVGFAFLFGWTLLALAIIRVYNGARWGGDWLEHFQRTLFFLHHFPVNTEIFGPYNLPARPPAPQPKMFWQSSSLHRQPPASSFSRSFPLS